MKYIFSILAFFMVAFGASADGVVGAANVNVMSNANTAVGAISTVVGNGYSVHGASAWSGNTTTVGFKIFEAPKVDLGVTTMANSHSKVWTKAWGFSTNEPVLFNFRDGNGLQFANGSIASGSAMGDGTVRVKLRAPFTLHNGHDDDDDDTGNTGNTGDKPGNGWGDDKIHIHFGPPGQQGK